MNRRTKTGNSFKGSSVKALPVILYGSPATSENSMFIPIKEKYEKAMEAANAIINDVQTLDDINDAIEPISSLEHELTSKKEARKLLADKAASMGFGYDKETKKFIAPKKKGEEQWHGI